MNIEKEVEKIYNELIIIRRNFHMYPELSELEIKTKEKICCLLDKWGIEYTTSENNYGVVGIIKGKKQGITVAARADMDALPLTERNDTPYISKNIGVMHACGHDVHTTILLGTAKILKKFEDEICGNVKLIFQPSEETVGGARPMIVEGCLENPDVKYIIGLHVQPFVVAGKIEIKYDNFYAATDEFQIVVNGKSSHGAYPEKSVDAIILSSNLITSLQNIVSRNISPLNSVVISIGKINGGTKSNIIANEVKIEGILRTLDEDTRNYTKNRIIEIANNICSAHGGNCIVEFKGGYKQLINDNNVVDIIKKVAIDAIGEDNIYIKQSPTMCGEDFAYFGDKAKSAFYHLGCGNKNLEINKPLHSDKFNVDETCIKTGVMLQVKSLLALLQN
ncbi:amidohydrolase [Sedimentibacter sp. zth1]|uniref:M20 metallopeptidase family protein n=1 Tax=Sedimentibacter sp. zth1 TaxID=2816908 RepID=UPI001A9242B5|nr:amidohydrolase [Sedimentibacter sp. zth1]QSX07357.1 amidohydrolase [Sedimentibacter sp. zth1]